MPNRVPGESRKWNNGNYTLYINVPTIPTIHVLQICLFNNNFLYSLLQFHSPGLVKLGLQVFNISKQPIDSDYNKTCYCCDKGSKTMQLKHCLPVHKERSDSTINIVMYKYMQGKMYVTHFSNIISHILAWWKILLIHALLHM